MNDPDARYKEDKVDKMREDWAVEEEKEKAEKKDMLEVIDERINRDKELIRDREKWSHAYVVEVDKRLDTWRVIRDRIEHPERYIAPQIKHSSFSMGDPDPDCGDQ